MKQLNRKTAVADWKTCLVALIAGLIITIIAFMFTHISFILTWLAVTVGSIPIWAQVIEWAKKKYPYCSLDEAIMYYLFRDDPDYDEEDENENSEENSISISPYY